MDSLKSPRMALIMVAITLFSLVAPPSTGPDAAARRHKQPVQREVVGGVSAPEASYPFVAAIGEVDPSGALLTSTPFCGGSLIAPSYVLTAAHCTIGWGPERFVVVVGRTDLSSNQGEVRLVTDIAVHPDYNRKQALNDLAILHLDRPVTTIAPIQLPGAIDSAFDAAGTPLTLAGWGDIVHSKRHRGAPDIPALMQERQVTVIDDAPCAKKWRKTGYKNGAAWSLLLCTTARAFASGDSGGPLFVQSNGTFIQIGVVSGHFDGKSNGKKLKNIPDYGPQLSAPASSSFIASIVGPEIAARRTSNASVPGNTEPHKARNTGKGPRDKR